MLFVFTLFLQAEIQRICALPEEVGGWCRGLRPCPPLGYFPLPWGLGKCYCWLRSATHVFIAWVLCFSLWMYCWFFMFPRSQQCFYRSTTGMSRERTAISWVSKRRLLRRTITTTKFVCNTYFLCCSDRCGEFMSEIFVPQNKWVAWSFRWTLFGWFFSWYTKFSNKSL